MSTLNNEPDKEELEKFYQKLLNTKEDYWSKIKIGFKAKKLEQEDERFIHVLIYLIEIDSHYKEIIPKSVESNWELLYSLLVLKLFNKPNILSFLLESLETWLIPENASLFKSVLNIVYMKKYEETCTEAFKDLSTVSREVNLGLVYINLASKILTNKTQYPNLSRWLIEFERRKKNTRELSIAPHSSQGKRKGSGDANNNNKRIKVEKSNPLLLPYIFSTSGNVSKNIKDGLEIWNSYSGCTRYSLMNEYIQEVFNYAIFNKHDVPFEHILFNFMWQNPHYLVCVIENLIELDGKNTPNIVYLNKILCNYTHEDNNKGKEIDPFNKLQNDDIVLGILFCFLNNAQNYNILKIKDYIGLVGESIINDFFRIVISGLDKAVDACPDLDFDFTSLNIVIDADTVNRCHLYPLNKQYKIPVKNLLKFIDCLTLADRQEIILTFFKNIFNPRNYSNDAIERQSLLISNFKSIILQVFQSNDDLQIMDDVFKIMVSTTNDNNCSGLCTIVTSLLNILYEDNDKPNYYRSLSRLLTIFLQFGDMGFNLEEVFSMVFKYNDMFDKVFFFFPDSISMINNEIKVFLFSGSTRGISDFLDALIESKNIPFRAKVLKTWIQQWSNSNARLDHIVSVLSLYNQYIPLHVFMESIMKNFIISLDVSAINDLSKEDNDFRKLLDISMGTIEANLDTRSICHFLKKDTNLLFSLINITTEIYTEKSNEFGELIVEYIEDFISDMCFCLENTQTQSSYDPNQSMNVTKILNNALIQVSVFIYCCSKKFDELFTSMKEIFLSIVKSKILINSIIYILETYSDSKVFEEIYGSILRLCYAIACSIPFIDDGLIKMELIHDLYSNPIFVTINPKMSQFAELINVLKIKLASFKSMRSIDFKKLGVALK